MWGIITDMWDDGAFGKFILFVLIVIILCISLGIWATIKEGQEWSTFSIEHKCKITGHMTGSTDVGYTSAGKGGIVVTNSPSKTAYLCDDGITYWR